MCFNYHRLSLTIIDYHAPFDRGFIDGTILLEIKLAKSEVNIAEYLPRRSRGKYSAIFTEPEVNNYFSIRNPIITARAVIIMHNSYIRLSRLY